MIDHPYKPRGKGATFTKLWYIYMDSYPIAERYSMSVLCWYSTIPSIYAYQSHTYIVGPTETCAEVETLHLHEHV